MTKRLKDHCQFVMNFPKAAGFKTEIKVNLLQSTVSSDISSTLPFYMRLLSCDHSPWSVCPWACLLSLHWVVSCWAGLSAWVVQGCVVLCSSMSKITYSSKGKSFFFLIGGNVASIVANLWSRCLYHYLTCIVCIYIYIYIYHYCQNTHIWFDIELNYQVYHL